MDEGLLPFSIDHFDDTLNFRTAYKNLFASITRLGQYTTELLQQCLEEDERHFIESEREDNYLRTTFVSEKEVKERTLKLFNAWLEYFVVHTELMHEIQMFVIEGKKVRITLGVHIFTELTRLNYLLERPRLMVDMYEEEMQSLENTHHHSWIEIVNSFDISKQYEEKEDKDAEVESRLVALKTLWKRPVMYYTQTQVQMVILFLTQQLNEVKSDSMVEFKRVFEWLWLRIAEIQKEIHTQDVLDDESMRVVVDTKESLYCANKDFGIFVSLYMGEMLRRFFYYEMLSKKKIEIEGLESRIHLKSQIDKCRLWVESVVNFFAEEAFVDLYVESCAESYAFVGDDKWFKYIWPQKVHSRAACLAELRPHLYRRFFSESRASRASILSSINTSHVSRCFVFKAISQYIQIKLGGASAVKWYEGVVIHSHEIYMSSYNLRANLAPFLLQVFSTYWAYDQGCVWKSDDFYESLAVWFHLLRTRYQSTLFGHDLTRFVDAAIGPPSPTGEEREVEILNQNQERLTTGFLL
jgi:hypothetical protein